MDCWRRCSCVTALWLSTSFHVCCLALSLVIFALAQSPSVVYVLTAVAFLGIVVLLLNKVCRDNRRTDLSATASIRTIIVAALKWAPLLIPLLMGAVLVFWFDALLKYVVDGSHNAMFNWVNGMRHDYSVSLSWWPNWFGGRSAEGLINRPLNFINWCIEQLPNIVKSMFDLVKWLLLVISIVGWIGWGCIALRSFLNVLARQIMTLGSPPLRVDFRMGFFR